MRREVCASVCVLKRGVCVCRASFDHESRIWDPHTGTCLCVFRDHTQPIYTLSFSKSGRLLATGAGDEVQDSFVSNIREYAKRVKWD